MTVRNTGNVAIWTGNGIEPDNWDRVAHWGAHTCASRWLNPGEDCFRDVAYLYTNNEWVDRSFILWGSSANPGWLRLFGYGGNFVAPQPTWRVQGVMGFFPPCVPAGSPSGTISGPSCDGSVASQLLSNSSGTIGHNTGVACGTVGQTCVANTGSCMSSYVLRYSYVCQ
jgi:hypothetical protein